MRHDTTKSHREYTLKTAEKDFARHVIATICDTDQVKVYRCSRQDTRNYSFFLSFLPGAILIHGDIGDLLIDRPSGGFEWLRNSISDMQYVLSKSSMAKLDTFMTGDALARLDDSEWLSVDERMQISVEWNPHEDTSGERWDEIVHDVTGDPDFDRCRYYSFRTLYCFAAVRWFFAALDAQQQPATTEAATNAAR